MIREAESVDGGYLCNGNLLIKKQEYIEGDVTVRRDTVKNVGDKPITLNKVYSRFNFDGGDYEVYNQYSQWCMESVGAWSPLSAGIVGKSHEVRANSTTNPFFALYNKQNQRGTVFHIISDGLWHYEVCRSFHQTGQKRTVLAEIGYDDFAYVLAPGEELRLPEVIYYSFKDKVDLDAYKLHAFVNKHKEPTLPVIYNTWMAIYDNVSTEILMPQLERAKYIGCEYFVIDAGWFGEKYKWFSSVGDWQEAEDCQMMGRMNEFADTVRKYGLKFGLWFEIERAALESMTVKEHPEYYLFEDGHAFIDFANPDARQYIFDKLSRNIRKYNIEFIKFDFNATLRTDPHNSAFIKFFAGYREFLKMIRDEFPDIYLENCASGGMRMNLTEYKHFNSFWISDNHSLEAQLKIYAGTLLRLPPSSMEKWITIGSIEKTACGRDAITVSGDALWGRVESVKESFLRAMMLGGPIGVSCDLTALMPNHLEILRTQIEKHKSERDFWRKAQARVLCDSDELTAIEYFDEDKENIKIITFTGRTIQNSYVAYPHCMGKYSCGDTVYNDLYENGISISAVSDYTAEIIELKKVKE